MSHTRPVTFLFNKLDWLLQLPKLAWGFFGALASASSERSKKTDGWRTLSWTWTSSPESLLDGNIFLDLSLDQHQKLFPETGKRTILLIFCLLWRLSHLRRKYGRSCFFEECPLVCSWSVAVVWVIVRCVFLSHGHLVDGHQALRANSVSATLIKWRFGPHMQVPAKNQRNICFFFLFWCLVSFPIATPLFVLAQSIIKFISSRPTCCRKIFKPGNFSSRRQGKCLDVKRCQTPPLVPYCSCLDCSLFTVLQHHPAVPTDNIPRDGTANPGWSSLQADLQPYPMMMMIRWHWRWRWQYWW